MSLNKFMHPRNIYKNPPNFKELAISYPDFRKHAKQDVAGKVSINFQDQEALRALTTALLKKDFGLEVKIPSGRLVPTLPLRLNYLLWIEDLLALSDANQEKSVRGIDIGTGASCIYPLLAAKKNGWYMIASETDPESVEAAQVNVENNNLKELIKVQLVDQDKILIPLVEKEEIYDFCMCNPPFFKNEEELDQKKKSRTAERPPPRNAWTGSTDEVVTPGGERQLISKIVEESLQLKNNVRIYTTMVGVKSDLRPLKEELLRHGITNTATTEFCQGRTTRWGLAWSFSDQPNLMEACAKHSHKKIKPMSYVVPNSNEPDSYTVEHVHEQVKELLGRLQSDKEKRDTRGRTPLMLAVTLGHLESARVLLQHTTNVNTENCDGWTVVQEAVATGDPELLQLVLERRDFQRYSSRVGGIPELLLKLKEAPDFYVEMKWEFTSWVPLVSRMCPSDTYKVYKQGSNVRIDTTLLGFDQTNWQRGNRSYIFKGQSDSAVMMEVDHETKQVYVEQMRMISPEELQFLQPSEEAISSRLTTPIVTTYIDTDKISFERNKSGIWGWRSDKSEPVNGHECKVFGASNVELVTKTRTEHLTETDKAKARSPKTPLQSFLGIAEVEEKQVVPEANNEEYCHVGNPCNISPEEYFDSEDLRGRDIGRPKEINTKIQKFKATLWLCEDYPLSLQEQIMPIVDLMAISSSHFAKLKDFIQMQLPAGFPVKIEIPLFHVLNARITFGNIFGMDEEVGGVSIVREEDRISCVVDDNCFVPPPSYTKMGAEVRRQFSMEEEDELLQFAIQQSLIEAGSEKDEVDIWEALRAQRPSRPTTPNVQAEEERQLQRAIQASLALYQHNLSSPSPEETSPTVEWTPPANVTERANDGRVERDLQLALALSQRESEEEQRQRQQEEETLKRVLELSLTDK